MNVLRCIILMQFGTIFTLGQPARQNNSSDLANKPEALVRNLYQQVVARHPLGIPYGADMKVFAPYLSRTLLHRFDLSDACFADWRRQNPDPDLKPSVGLIENGIFSGGDVKAEPRAFRIERTETERDGSFRVYVRLTWGVPTEKSLTWRVAAVIVKENGHFVVDDVLYLKDKSREVDSRLSEDLSPGCDGPRWVGGAEQPIGQKQQK